jgi:hypothetical protein
MTPIERRDYDRNLAAPRIQLPLGLELAAALVRALPCHEIVAEIERNSAF